MRFPPPSTVLSVLDRLESCGYAAYLVGGCVRDDMLGIQPKEYDICSAATPEQLRDCLKGERLLDTGLKHGTLTLLIEDQRLEITTFRSDGSYSDSRHPDSVRFSDSIEEDLKRRDFTVNAMAWSPKHGLVDPHGGAEDCAARVLRAVGDPMQRFAEDALRILRGLRFSAVLGFDIEADSYQAMLSLSPNLKRISAERIGKELNLLLVGRHARKTLSIYPRLVFAVLPELEPMLFCPQRSRYHVYGVWEHSLMVLEHTPLELPLRWAALFHDSGKPTTAMVDPDGRTHFRGHPKLSVQIAGDCLRRLRQSNRLIEEVELLVLHHDDRVDFGNLQLWLSRLGFESLRRLILLQAADLEGHAPTVRDRAEQAGGLIKQAADLIRSGACLAVKDLAIGGRRLIALGFPENALIGDTLDDLLELVLTGRAPNEPEALEALALQRLDRWRQEQIERD